MGYRFTHIRLSPLRHQYLSESDHIATVTRRNEKKSARIAAYNENGQKLRQKIEMWIHPLQADEGWPYIVAQNKHKCG